MGGYVSDAVGGKMISSLGTPFLAGGGSSGFALTFRQSVGVGLFSRVAGGAAGRAARTVVSNVRNNTWNSVLGAALNPAAMFSDAVSGAIG